MHSTGGNSGQSTSKTYSLSVTDAPVRSSECTVTSGGAPGPWSGPSYSWEVSSSDENGVSAQVRPNSVHSQSATVDINFIAAGDYTLTVTGRVHYDSSCGPADAVGSRTVQIHVNGEDSNDPDSRWSFKEWRNRGEVFWRYDQSSGSYQSYASSDPIEVDQWSDPSGDTQRPDRNTTIPYTKEEHIERNEQEPSDQLQWVRHDVYTAHSICDNQTLTIDGRAYYCHCDTLNSDIDPGDNQEATAQAQGPSSGSQQVSGQTGGLSNQDDSPQGPGASSGGQGAPLWVVDRTTMNLFMQDKPLWYHSPIGPDVTVTMTYNSQSNASLFSVFGRRWLFNYSSSLTRDPATGNVTVALPNGRFVTFLRDAKESYATATPGKYFLDQVSDHRFVVSTASLAGSSLIYDEVPGAKDNQLMVVALRDAWKQSLTFGYNAQAQLTTITNAQGLVWNVGYDDKGHILQIGDPFGRSTKFAYDAIGNMVQSTDMGGNVFTYHYDDKAKPTSLESPLGTWQFRLEEPSRESANSSYPALGEPMGRNRRITITDPLGDKEEYFFDAAQDEVQHVDQNHYVPFSVGHNNDSPDVVKTVWHHGEMIRDNGVEIDAPELSQSEGNLKDVALSREATKQTDETNAEGNVEPSQVDRKGAITDPEAEDVADNTDDTQYTLWGAPLIATVNGHTTTYTYDDKSKNLLTVSRDGQLQDTYTYDAVGRVQTDAKLGQQTLTYSYNDLNRLTRVTYSDGTHEDYKYQFLDLVNSFADRAGHTVTLQYDPLKRLVSREDSLKGTISFEYDAAGNRTSMTDSKGNVTRWKFNDANQKEQTLYADGSTETYERDGQGLFALRRAPNGDTTRFKHNKNGDLIEIDYPHSPTVTISYDNHHHPVEMHDAVGVTKWTYDVLGNLMSMDGPWANDTVSYTYDEDGWRSSMKIGDNFTVSYNRNQQGKTTSVESPAGEFDYSYAPSGELSALDMPNGTQTRYKIADGQLLGIENLAEDDKVLSRYNYTLDAAQLRTAVTQQMLGATPTTTQFGYDANEQLTDEKTPTQTAHYTYDATGNRLSEQTGQQIQAYRYNSVNELVDITGSAQKFDTNGNLVDDGTHHYTYDDAGHLVEVVVIDPATQANKTKSEFVYDGLNHRRIDREWVWKEGQWQLKGETHFVYDVSTVVQERDANNKITATYTRGLERTDGVGGILARTITTDNGNQSFYYNYDGVGNVVQLTSEQGNVAASYSYDAWGNILMATGPQANQPYRFNTRAYHSASGLYDFGLRFYSPRSGRWISRDPIGEIGGLNLYRYVHNNPLNRIEIWGLGDPSYGGHRHTSSPTNTDDLVNAYGSFFMSMGDVVSFGATATLRQQLGLDEGMSGVYNPSAMNYGRYAGVALNYFVGDGEATAALQSLRNGLTVANGAIASYNAMRSVFFDRQRDVDSSNSSTSAAVRRCRERRRDQAKQNLLAARADAIRAANRLARRTDQIVGNSTHSNCFVAGTPVLMADGTLKRIEQVQAGDMVESKDPITGKERAKRVIRAFRNLAPVILNLTLANGEMIATTPGHPFATSQRGSFVFAGDLPLKTQLQEFDGHAVGLASETRQNGPTPIFNFEVQDFHTYFVGKSHVWVHNQSRTTLNLLSRAVQDKVRIAREMRGNLPPYGTDLNGGRTTHTIGTVSGRLPPLESGYSGSRYALAESARDRARQMNSPFAPDRRDPRGPRWFNGDGVGIWNAGHAENLLIERQFRNNRNPETPITVNNSTCNSCRNYLRDLARHDNLTLTVADPNCVRVFSSNGQVRVIHDDGSVNIWPRGTPADMLN